MITDTRPILWDAVERGRPVLCEGAQGSLLDIDHGTYPFVTSSSCTAGGAATGSGLPPSAFTRVVGIFKAYCTRVGNGPFPTEDTGAGGARLREIGHEYGTTTGRPRRCGWFDAVAARTAVKVNGITDIALTKLDVLDGFSELKVCTAYKVGGRELEYFPPDARELARARPQYVTVPGWEESTNGRRVATMPGRSLEYVRYLERLVDCRVHLVSLGPDRTAMIKLPRARGSGAGSSPRAVR
jgi:adenylosuccinate synthase